MTTPQRQKRPEAELAAEYKARVVRAAARSALRLGLVAAGLLAAGILAIVARWYPTGLILVGLAATVGVLFLDAMLQKNEVAQRPAKFLAPNLSALRAARDKLSDAAKTDTTT